MRPKLPLPIDVPVTRPDDESTMIPARPTPPVSDRRAAIRTTPARTVASQPAPLKPLYDCLKCPAYCCSYERINVSGRDIARLAKHFGITTEQATTKFTKIREGERVLRHQKDKIYGTICMNIDQTTRKCSVYEARPAVCREYPEKRRCGYYEFLSWERKHQDNEDFIPLPKG